MNKTCQNCNKEFKITEDDQKFYGKISVPAPTFCPDCRLKRRFAFRNERTLYKRNCDLCKKNIVSMYCRDVTFPVYCIKCWYSDKWDAMEYGRDYDFNKPFFEQWSELLNQVPQIALVQKRTVNSNYVNRETDVKNCYLDVGGHYNEDCAYNTYALRSRNVFDNYWIFNSENCYNSINCVNCYNTNFSQHCLNCIDTFFSYDCRGCSDIIGCVGLRNKKYYIFNKPYYKEEYLEKVKEFDLGSYKNIQELKQKFRKFLLLHPKRFNAIIKSVNCTGNDIENSKNCANCFSVEKVEDSKYMVIAAEIKDSFDCSSIGMSTGLCYEVISSGGKGVYKLRFSFDIFECMNIEYSYSLLVGSNSNIFGCISLRNKQYCILNKQYTKEEYEELVLKIIKHMG
ncbi:MAG: zinc-ribbon domain containing protein [Patescibacteria group bacterium]